MISRRPGIGTKRSKANASHLWARRAPWGDCESAWEPTPEELALLNAGASIVLRVYGGQPAPVGALRRRRRDAEADGRGRSVKASGNDPGDVSARSTIGRATWISSPVWPLAGGAAGESERADAAVVMIPRRPAAGIS